jgi:dTDP-glucose 4,6-dehydratase
MHNCSLFVTGGTGFFGAWLLESFAYCNRKLELNAQMTALTRDPGGFLAKMPHLASEPSVNFLQGDVRSFGFPEQRFDGVIHAAAPASGPVTSQPMDLMRTILHGTERAVAFSKECEAKRFLFVSSGAVYGRQPETLSHVGEDYLGGPNWLDPNAVYAEGKRISEQICSIAAKDSGIDFAIARCFAFVGPGLPLDQHFAIGNFIGDALAGRNIRVQGDGTPMRSYLYAADLAVWLWTMLLREPNARSNPRVFNVGSGEAISIRDLAQTVVEELNPSLHIQIAKPPRAGQRVEQYVPSVQKAESCLGLRPRIELRDAIRRTAAWHR